MSMRENLTKAKAMITPPENWCQGAFARDKGGDPVPANSPDACCRCTLGAVGAALGIPLSEENPLTLPPEYIRLLDESAREVAKANYEGDEDDFEDLQVVELNDDEIGLTIKAHDAVMQTLDVAIARAPN